MTPSQHVALAGVAFCAVVLAAVCWRHPALWCAWVQAWTRLVDAIALAAVWRSHG